MTSYLNAIAFVSHPPRKSCECETEGPRTGDASAFAANLCPLAPIGFISELLQPSLAFRRTKVARLAGNRFAARIPRATASSGSEAFERRSASALELNDRQLASGNRMLLCPGGESCCLAQASCGSSFSLCSKRKGNRSRKS
jgi:hypothetical protein